MIIKITPIQSQIYLLNHSTCLYPPTNHLPTNLLKNKQQKLLLQFKMIEKRTIVLSLKHQNTPKVNLTSLKSHIDRKIKKIDAMVELIGTNQNHKQPPTTHQQVQTESHEMFILKQLQIRISESRIDKEERRPIQENPQSDNEEQQHKQKLMEAQDRIFQSTYDPEFENIRKSLAKKVGKSTNLNSFQGKSSIYNSIVNINRTQNQLGSSKTTEKINCATSLHNHSIKRNVSLVFDSVKLSSILNHNSKLYTSRKHSNQPKRLKTSRNNRLMVTEETKLKMKNDIAKISCHNRLEKNPSKVRQNLIKRVTKSKTIKTK